MKIEMPSYVKNIIGTITAAGFEAFAVGGCIRDSILGRPPEDWDITTSARPEEVKALFGRTVDTGIQHGTVTVILNKRGFEVTTYRIDGKYEDSRHPSEVVFTPSLKEDMRRRDFTINAMAYNDEAGLVDEFGGISDIENHIIRCVGDARMRFTEDALRIMRAIRFSAQLGYEIEENTREAMGELKDKLKQISAERILTELTKLLVSDHPDYLREAYEAGITSVILPEFDLAMETPQNHPHHCYNVGEHILHSLLEIPGKKELRLAMLFHDIGKPDTYTIDQNGMTHFNGHARISANKAVQILKRLRSDNQTIRRVENLVLYHDFGYETRPDKAKVRRTIHRIGEEYFPDVFAVKRADILAQSEYKREEKLARLAEWEQLYEEIIKEQECISLKDLAVTGADLIAAGMKPGKVIGETLNRLLDLVLENPAYNSREYLLNQVYMEKS